MTDIGSLHILVIDDEVSILKLISRLLSRKNFQVDTAENGEEGIKKFQSNHYCLVLTDMKMPGISGAQVCDYIKDYTDIPVIGMSGTPWLMDQARFDAVLHKPYAIGDLFQAIQKCLDHELTPENSGNNRV